MAKSDKKNNIERYTTSSKIGFGFESFHYKYLLHLVFFLHSSLNIQWLQDARQDPWLFIQTFFLCNVVKLVVKGLGSCCNWDVLEVIQM